MINDSICCTDIPISFLAVAPVKPQGVEKSRKTVKEIRKLGNELEAVLDSEITKEELDAFWGIGTERQQLEAQKAFLLEQQRNLDGRREGR